MDMATHAVGSRVWCQDNAEAWQKAEVVRVTSPLLTVLTERGVQLQASAKDLPLQNPEVRGVEDMTKLSYLHEPGVLWNLQCRYGLDAIYTYTGTILIAVNPFAALPQLYGPHMMDQYRGIDLGELSPHVYAIADAAYRQMRKEWKGQSILVSGESGAGKTETSKLIMKYLAYMGGYSDTGEASGSGRSVEEQVLESNPLLEAFGNAKTVRNDNSSRFGKYVEINFNKKGVISGAAIRTYLLERSRVVAVNNPERNYHIFYQLCEGAPAADRKKLHLGKASDYHYLNQSTCYDLPGVNNAEEYKRTVLAMTRVGIPLLDQESIFRTVAAVLHLGNVRFHTGADEAAVPTDARSQEHLQHAAELLGVEWAALCKALATRTRHTPEGPIVSPLDARAATEARDSLAKIIYAKLFDWLVACVNAAIGEDTQCAASVGVLDIYGFESFTTNDFEQFCINLANEKLQQHFNHHVFKMEQAEYEREKIDWSYIKFVDNQDVLDLIESKMGILDLLDEQCRFPTATAADLAQKLYTTGACKDSERFSKPKTSNTAFTVNHYAGNVTYETTNFLDKNKDFVVAEHQNLLANSSYPFTSQLFYEAPDPAGAKFKGFKFNSVGSQFKKQLAELMSALLLMEPHYIRCIKPNSVNKSGLFENANVLHQLRCGGVLEAVRISCAGFPSKRPYEDFVDHFWQLAPELLKDPTLTDREVTKRIIEAAGVTGYQLGQTKAFMRAGGMAELDKLRTERLNGAAVTVQRYVRGYISRLSFARVKKATVLIQAAARAAAARRMMEAKRLLHAATTFQCFYRSWAARRDYAVSVTAIKRVQAMWRGRTARARFDQLRRLDAASVLQAAWRGAAARAELRAARAAAVTMQSAWRGRVAKAELRALRQDASDSSKLLEDKKALEKKVAELHATLQTVQDQRNELRQQVKDEKASVWRLEAALKAAGEEQAALAIAASTAVASGELVAEQEARARAEQELEVVRAQLVAAQEAATKQRADSDKKLSTAQEYIQRQLSERSDIEKKFHAMKDDLITRLQNACAQRDEARAEVLALQNEMEKMREEGVAAAQVARMPTTPGGPLANGQLTPGMAGVQRLMPESAKTMFSSLTNSMGLTPGMTTPTGTRPEDMGRGNLTPASAAESELERKAKELAAKQQAALQERRKAEEERLLGALASPLGFHKNRPVAALSAFRCCLQWRTFQADRTTLFDRIIGVIGSQIESHQEDNALLAYWLANTVTLVHLLHKNVKPATSSLQSKSRPVAATARSVFSTMFSGRSASTSAHAEASIHGGGIGGFKQVEAKYPALLFKQQLDAFVQKVFPMIRDNVKRQITPLLTNCIHMPKSGARGMQAAINKSQDAGAGIAQLRSWPDILLVLEQLLATLKDNHVPSVLVKALFKQLFSFINVQLFNQLLLRRECCSFSNGEYVKIGLGQVESWIQSQPSEFLGDSWEELRYIRQAVSFLVVGNKHKRSLEDITVDLCPGLSIQQLYRISTMYWDERYNTETVSSDVLGQMKQRMVDSTASTSHSFLLDDDSTLPFVAAEVLANIDDKDLFAGLPVPEPLKDAPANGMPGPDAGGGTPVGAPSSGTTSGFAFLERELRLGSA